MFHNEDKQELNETGVGETASQEAEGVFLAIDTGAEIFKHVESAKNRLQLSLASRFFNDAYKQLQKIKVNARIAKALKKHGVHIDMEEKFFTYLPFPCFMLLHDALGPNYNISADVEAFLMQASSDEMRGIDSHRFKFLIVVASLKEFGFNFHRLDKSKTIHITDQNKDIIDRLLLTIAANRTLFGITDSLGITESQSKYKKKNRKACQQAIETLMSSDAANQWVYEFFIESLNNKTLNQALINSIMDKREANKTIRQKFTKSIKNASSTNPRLALAFLNAVGSLNEEAYAMVKVLASGMVGAPEKDLPLLCRACDSAPDAILITRSIFGDGAIITPYVKALFDAQLIAYKRNNLGGAVEVQLKGAKRSNLAGTIEVITAVAIDSGYTNPIHVFSLLIYTILCDVSSQLLKVEEIAKSYFDALKKCSQSKIAKNLPERLTTKIKNECKNSKSLNDFFIYTIQSILFYSQALMASPTVLKNFLEFSDYSPGVLYYLKLVLMNLDSNGEIELNDNSIAILQEFAHALVSTRTRVEFNDVMKIIEKVAKHFHPSCNVASRLPNNVRGILAQNAIELIDYLDGYDALLQSINELDQSCLSRILAFENAFLILLKLDLHVSVRSGTKFICGLFSIDNEDELIRATVVIDYWSNQANIGFNPFTLVNGNLNYTLDFYNFFLSKILYNDELRYWYFKPIDYFQPVEHELQQAQIEDMIIPVEHELQQVKFEEMVVDDVDVSDEEFAQSDDMWVNDLAGPDVASRKRKFEDDAEDDANETIEKKPRFF